MEPPTPITMPPVRSYSDVARELVALGEPAVPLLIAHLDRRDPRFLECADVLASIGSPAVGPLAEAAAKEPSKRWSFVWALLRMTPPPKEAAPALLHALEDSDAWIRSMAAVALARIDADLAGEAAVPVILKDLERHDTEFLATWALSEIGPVSEQARGAIEKARAGKYWADLTAGPRG